MPDDRKEIESLTIPLWPDAGKRLGLGKSKTYKAAHADPPQIPGLINIGGYFRVARKVLERALGEEA
jgi:hypothetical protein